MSSFAATLGIACSLASGDLCIPAPYDKVVDTESLIYYTDLQGHRLGPNKADVRRLGVEIFRIYSDNIHDVRPGPLSRACAGDLCVLYHKHCSLSGLECFYTWGAQPAPSPPGAEPKLFFTQAAIRIVAHNLHTMRRTEAAIYITLGEGANAHQLPVSALDQTRPEEEPPGCPTSRVVPDCPDLTTPEKRYRIYRADPP